MTKIRFNPFDAASIDEAIKRLDEKEREIEENAAVLTQLLTDLGVRTAKDLVPVYTGEALNSIVGYMDGNRGVIQAGGYCKFIEFGTGVKGEAQSHPSAEWIAIMNWAYGVGGTIFTTKDGRTGWFYPADDGTWKFTEGMPSRPFMFDTALELKHKALEMAKEVFGGGGKG